MRLLYLPNEPIIGGQPWCQVGGRDALARLHDNGQLSALEINSFRQADPQIALREIFQQAERFQPDVILFTKIGVFPVTDDWFARLRALKSGPSIVYYDGDIYGRVFKRLNSSTQTMIRNADLVLVCGLGQNAESFKDAGAKKIRYLRHNASLRQFGEAWSPTGVREFDVVVIGNRIPPRVALQARVPWGRMPGAFERDELVRALGRTFGRRFAVFGSGWETFIGNQGPIPFERQHEALRRGWMSIGYDHFPETPFYFSDRLPIALMSGVAHLCHYHPGYDTMFQNGRELLWAHDVGGLVELAQVALSRGSAFLQRIADTGRTYALENLTTEVVFAELIEAIALNRERVRNR